MSEKSPASKPLRLIFCGTPAFGLPSLKQLLTDARFEVVAVISQPDRPRGRGHEISASPIKEFALANNLRVFQPNRIGSDESREFFATISPDAVVIIAYGQIVPDSLLKIPRLGWINLHASLLPKYRGAAPINWAIVNGESFTGNSTMQVDSGMDTGAVLLQSRTEIGGTETAPELAARLAELGAALVVESLIGLAEKTLTPEPQDNANATRAPLLRKEHGRINWNLTSSEIYDRIRGLAPWPGAFTSFRGHLCHFWGKPASSIPEIESHSKTHTPGTIIRSGDHLFVACGDRTCLELTELQLEGRKRVSAAEFQRGARLAPDESFSSEAPTPPKSAPHD